MAVLKIRDENGVFHEVLALKGEPGAVGADGGYYTPSVSQSEDNKISISFIPSKDNMPEIAPVEVDLPVPDPSESVSVDPTLKIAGQAADAEAVGEAISQLSETLKTIKEITVNGIAPDANGNIVLPVYGGEVADA